jgi:hypothetical protein
MIIIFIERKEVLIWTKWLAAKILGLSALLPLVRRPKQNSLKRFWNMAAPFTTCKISHPTFIIRYNRPFGRDIAIWKMNYANTGSAAVRKTEDNTVSVTFQRGHCFWRGTMGTFLSYLSNLGETS